MTKAAERSSVTRWLLVVHGHREGNAVGGRAEISAEALARVRRAEQIARHRRIEKVLFCGAGAPGHPSEARQMAARWRGPAVQALLDERSTDSAENAAEALEWARKLGVRNLIVVSSWWHIRLPGYYRNTPGTNIHHARCWRWDQPLRRLCHELRYLPRVPSSRKAARATTAAAQPTKTT